VAKEANSIPKASVRPPSTAVKRVDLMRHSAMTTDADNNEMDQLAAPNQPKKK
jgi:hypothetical protein